MGTSQDPLDNYARLETLLSDLKRVSVLVVGDLMLDEYLYGTTERISPEAPVGVLALRSHNHTLGGAANVANNLVHLGCEVFLAGIVGQDQAKEQLCQLSQAAGIHTAGFLTDSDRPTTTKTRIVSHGQQILRIDKEVRTSLTQVQERTILSYAEEIMSRVDGVILSDYAKGVLTPSLCQSLIRTARGRGLAVLVDPKGEDFSKYREASLLTPNKKEVRDAAHMSVQTESQLEQAVRRLLSVVDCPVMLVTRGEEGMSLYKAEGPVEHIKTETQDVFDITGAGDTVIAMMGRVLFAGHDTVSAAHLANIAAGIKISKLGTAVIDTEEILHWLRSREEQHRGKILDQFQLKQIVSRAHSLNKKVVFTNGCFDLLHVGHIHLLLRAKVLGDLLVVAINDDESVRKLKGDGRPLVTAGDRARIISALECVDYVTIFSEPTPLHLIREIKPDILVKGSDYALNEVVGREEVEKYGGRVELIPLVEGKSSSSIVRHAALQYRPPVASPD